MFVIELNTIWNSRSNISWISFICGYIMYSLTKLLAATICKRVFLRLCIPMVTDLKVLPST